MTDAVVFLSEYRVFICRVCPIGVDRRHLQTHFKKQHSYTPDQLRTINAYRALQRHDETGPSVPSFLSTPIPELPLIYDGLLCQVDPTVCRYLCRRLHGIKRHCRTAHQWRQYPRRGRPRQAGRARSPPSSEQDPVPWKIVVCQRVFTAGPQSHYIEVRHPLSTEPSVQGGSRSADVWQKIEDDRTQAQEKLFNVVAEDPALQTNPWLNRTRWSTYLRGFERQSLLKLVEEPDAGTAPLERYVWDTI